MQFLHDFWLLTSLIILSYFCCFSCRFRNLYWKTENCSTLVFLNFIVPEFLFPSTNQYLSHITQRRDSDICRSVSVISCTQKSLIATLVQEGKLSRKLPIFLDQISQVFFFIIMKTFKEGKVKTSTMKSHTTTLFQQVLTYCHI